MIIEVKSQQLELLPEKALFWHNAGVLVLADVHMGKVTHFRRHGIPLPGEIIHRSIDRLVNIIDKTQPQVVIFLGDLFHSHYNTEWEFFGQVIAHYSAISFRLCEGNHDILGAHQYQRKNVQVAMEIVMAPFVFCHHPVSSLDPELYPMTGHIHPGVRLTGKGRQGLTVPCFYFGKQQAYLPAFGELTGSMALKPSSGDRIFVVSPQEVISIN